MDTRVHDELPRVTPRVFFRLGAASPSRSFASFSFFRVRESRPLCVLQLLTLTDQRALHLVIVEQRLGQRQRVLRARRAERSREAPRAGKPRGRACPECPRRGALPCQQPSDRLLRVRAPAGCVRPPRAPPPRAPRRRCTRARSAAGTP